MCLWYLTLNHRFPHPGLELALSSPFALRIGKCSPWASELSSGTCSTMG